MEDMMTNTAANFESQVFGELGHELKLNKLVE